MLGNFTIIALLLCQVEGLVKLFFILSAVGSAPNVTPASDAHLTMKVKNLPEVTRHSLKKNYEEIDLNCFVLYAFYSTIEVNDKLRSLLHKLVIHNSFVKNF